MNAARGGLSGFHLQGQAKSADGTDFFFGLDEGTHMEGGHTIGDFEL